MHVLDAAWRVVTDEFDFALSRAVDSARAKVIEELNQVVRRLARYDTEADWYNALLDGAARFASEAALFAIEGETLICRAIRGFNLPDGLTIPLPEAAAFNTARRSGELVLALCTPGEVSRPLAAALAGTRGYVIPISNAETISAFLFTSVDKDTDSNALELIANAASAFLKQRSLRHKPLQILPAAATVLSVSGDERQTARPRDITAPEHSETWAQLDLFEKLVHVRAQRLARTKVAEMQLYRPEACRAGLEQQDLYLFLKREIDAARAVFRNQFSTTDSMVDYFHHELLHQLTNNDEALLGADYPGPMV
jgi:hypothetical protein